MIFAALLNFVILIGLVALVHCVLVCLLTIVAFETHRFSKVVLTIFVVFLRVGILGKVRVLLVALELILWVIRKCERPALLILWCHKILTLERSVKACLI
jgi:hypothetical protein